MGYQENAGHFSLSTGWEQILKFVLHTNKFLDPGQLNCLAFQKLKLGNGSREGTLKTRNGGKKHTSSGCSWLHWVCPLSFHPWIVVSYFSRIKTTETCVWEKAIDKMGCFFPPPPLPTLFLVFPKILFLAENSRVAEEDRSAQPERNLELYPQRQWHLNQLSLKQWNLTLPWAGKVPS